MLSSNGSRDTCISLGVSTFLHAAFTAHDLREEGGQGVVPADNHRQARVLCREVRATHTDLQRCGWWRALAVASAVRVCAAECYATTSGGRFWM